jgi:L-threonylcarbamoyladenylate synthase
VKTELHNALKCLYNEGIILYLTDTVWGIGCDAMNEEAVAKVFNIKQRNESKSLIILVDSLEMLKQYVDEVPDTLIEILKKFSKPTTVIYSNSRRLAKNVIASDNTVAIRIVQDKFCKELIKQYGKPIVSTSANISGKPTPKSFKEIDISILDAVDYVVNLHRNKISNIPSSIIKINDKDEVEVIRT